MKLIFGILCLSFASNSIAEAKRLKKTFQASARIDCAQIQQLGDGGNQPCLQVSSLRLGILQDISPRLSVGVALDPFGTPVSRYKHGPRLKSQPRQDENLPLVDDYFIRWQARPKLIVGLEKHSGTTYLPNHSGLAWAHRFTDTGWDQSSLSLTYQLPTLNGTYLKLVVGNGEGENGENLDPQQYFGLRLDAHVIKGMIISAAISMDGNNSGSQQNNWLTQQFKEDCLFDLKVENRGYSTQRMAASLALDGNLPPARGLKAGLGWQVSTMTDLARNRLAGASEEQRLNCRSLPIDDIFFEDPNGEILNQMEKSVVSVNASYRILDTYFFGFDYELKTLKSLKINPFYDCLEYENGRCLSRGEARKVLKQDAFSLGFGLDLDDQFTFVVEFHRQAYDRNYDQIFYSFGEQDISRKLEVINLRVQYGWL